jgi:carbon-monoxide dehydrogenase medium subunit
MRPVPFEYHRAENLDHALDVLGAHGYDAMPLAGGQSLVPMMNLRLARPAVLVDINGLDCGGVEVDGNNIAVGALTRHRAVLDNAEIGRAAPIVHEAYRHLAHPVIRNRGTSGGSVAYADPTAEIPALLILLDGTINLASRNGMRSVAAGDFFLGAFTTAIEPGELVTGFELHLPQHAASGAFAELALRHGDYAVASAGALISLENEKISGARIVVSGAEGVPIRVTAVENMLIGEKPSDTLFSDAGRSASQILEGYGDIRASADYRKLALGQLVNSVVARSTRHAVSGAS